MLPIHPKSRQSKFPDPKKLCSSELDVKMSVKAIKKLANISEHDERHAPKVLGESKRLSTDDQSVAMNHAYDILESVRKVFLIKASVK